LNCDVSARSHRAADLGGGKRRRVVDAVARLGDDAALLAQAVYDLALVFGQDISLDVLDIDFAADRLGGRLVGSRKHDAANAIGAQGVESGCGRPLDRVGDRQDASRFPVDGDEDRRGALSAQLFRNFVERRNVDSSGARIIIWLPMTTLRPSIVPVTPLSEGASKSSADANVNLRSDAAFTIAAASGCLLPRSRPAAGRSTSSSVNRPGSDGDDFRVALGEHAGLVYDQRVDLLQTPPRSRVLDQYAQLRPATDSDHDRHGVASPSARGHAMMSTETAATSPYVNLGSGPHIDQPAKATKATAMTAGTNHSAIRSARRWIGA
jgi:hypothetical protein